MSGGSLIEYKQFELKDFDDAIQRIIDHNDKPDIENELDYGYGYSPETIAKFKEGQDILRKAYVYVQRIDWLVSGDDAEETFHERLAEDLAELDTEQHI